MINFNIDADILPGHSAAGFLLGMNTSDIDELLRNAQIVNEEDGVNILELLKSSSGVVCVKSSTNSLSSSKLTIYFRNDMVRLSFNAEGALYNIFVSEGYLGLLQNKIKVGDKLGKVLSEFPLFFDEGDDMHYPDDEKGANVKGISFYATDEEAEDNPDQIITGISVHDWNLIRG